MINLFLIFGRLFDYLAMGTFHKKESFSIENSSFLIPFLLQKASPPPVPQQQVLLIQLHSLSTRLFTSLYLPIDNILTLF